MSACLFCQFVAGDAPCDLVHEDETTMTFMDLYPVGRGHLLVIPKRHAENLFEIERETLGRIVHHSQNIAHALREVFEPDAIAVHQLNGEAAGQTIFHYHMHLIPRWNGDPKRVRCRTEGKAAELAENARLVREALARQLEA